MNDRSERSQVNSRMTNTQNGGSRLCQQIHDLHRNGQVKKQQVEMPEVSGTSLNLRRVKSITRTKVSTRQLASRMGTPSPISVTMSNN